MKIDNIKNVIKFLEVSETYDQSNWAHDCGTPACIFGHAAALNQNVETFDWDIIDFGYIQASGTDYMGFTDRFDIVESLSRPYPLRDENAYHHPTNKQAIEVLNHLIETGEVDWGIISHGC